MFFCDGRVFSKTFREKADVMLVTLVVVVVVDVVVVVVPRANIYSPLVVRDNPDLVANKQRMADLQVQNRAHHWDCKSTD